MAEIDVNYHISLVDGTVATLDGKTGVWSHDSPNIVEVLTLSASPSQFETTAAGGYNPNPFYDAAKKGAQILHAVFLNPEALDNEEDPGRPMGRPAGR